MLSEITVGAIVVVDCEVTSELSPFLAPVMVVLTMISLNYNLALIPYKPVKERKLNTSFIQTSTNERITVI